MKSILCYFKIFFVLLIIITSCSTQKPFPKLQGPYLGQTPPGMTPEIFAPDFVSTALDEFGCTFSVDGKEFYFTRTLLTPTKRHSIMTSYCRNGVWSQPEIAPFSGIHSAGEPNISPDGKQLFFGRLFPNNNGGSLPMTFKMVQTDHGWSEPQKIMSGMFTTASARGNLFFTDVSNGMEKGDIVKSIYQDGQYQPPEKLKGGVNSPFQDAHPFISPDESYLIFDSNRPGGFGSSDLYISFKKESGIWGDAINLDDKINTSDYNAIPYVSPDGKYLFFNTTGDIYWVDASVIEAIRLQTTK